MKDEKSEAKAVLESEAMAAPAGEAKASRGRQAGAPDAYEPPRLLKFDKLEKLIVSGE